MGTKNYKMTLDKLILLGPDDCTDEELCAALEESIKASLRESRMLREAEIELACNERKLRPPPDLRRVK